VNGVSAIEDAKAHDKIIFLSTGTPSRV